MNRRQFLQSSFAGLAAFRIEAAEAPRVNFPRDPRARLAVASYPFRQFLNAKTGNMTLLDFPKMVVERFGVSGIEPLDQHFASTDAAYLGKFREALLSAKAHVVNIPVGRLHGSFYDADADKRKITIAAARNWVDVAVAIGSPSIRTHVSGPTPQDSTLAAESLKQVADYGAEKNVVIHLENDSPKTEEAFFLLDIIAKANTPWLRALPDFGNSKILERGDGYETKALTAMFQHAYGISHVKDTLLDNKKLYQVDVTKIFAIAKASGYRGYYSIEFDADGDPYEPTRRLIEESLHALSESKA
jgi:sugar phosphate isomerase/epimerase